MKNEIQAVVVGSKMTVAFALDSAGKMHAKVFLESEIDVAEARKLHRVFEALANAGIVVNTEKFHHIEGDIWGVKSFQARVACFRDGNLWLLTHGFVKKQDRWPRAEIERALRIMAEHKARKDKR